MVPTATKSKIGVKNTTEQYITFFKLCRNISKICDGCDVLPIWDALILLFALGGGFGWCCCRDGSLIEGGRYFVDVIQCKEGEYQTGGRGG